MSTEQKETEQQHEMDKTPGIFSWHEIVTNETAGSEAFYTKLFGWTTSTMEVGEGFQYTMFSNAKGTPVAGLVPTPPEAKGAPTMWMNYVTVGNLDEAVAKAKELGATIQTDVTQIPMGRFAIIGDPQGATTGLWEYGDC